jgi:hypothetical protein
MESRPVQVCVDADHVFPSGCERKTDVRHRDCLAFTVLATRDDDHGAVDLRPTELEPRREELERLESLPPVSSRERRGERLSLLAGRQRPDHWGPEPLGRVLSPTDPIVKSLPDERDDQAEGQPERAGECEVPRQLR